MGILLMDIDGYFIGGYWCLLMIIGGYWCLLINIILMVIGGYSLVSHWWLLMGILLMVINGYCIICYITTIGDYYIVNYCLILSVIIS
jgi:hypothetical protein